MALPVREHDDHRFRLKGTRLRCFATSYPGDRLILIKVLTGFRPQVRT